MSAFKPEVKKCVNCDGKFKRRSESYHGEKEPYKGNMICYGQKENKIYSHLLGKSYNDELIQGDYIRSEYSYFLWDGNSYRNHGGYFCSGKCSKQFARECATQGMRRLGYSLVRFNKGDRRAG
tara:strand:- start:3657 stop:4025 length:369 start_codon:yes stop_codon:yes gene_type:complete